MYIGVSTQGLWDCDGGSSAFERKIALDITETVVMSMQLINAFKTTALPQVVLRL